MVAFWKRTRRIGREPKRKAPVACEPDLGVSRSIAPGRGMDTPCLEFPMHGRMPIVSQCVVQSSSPKCSDCETTYSLGSVQTTMIPLHHFKVSFFFACVAIPQGARFWFRRLIFTHANVLTLTIRNCCRKCRVGACSHSVRKVCVCVCVSLDACEVPLPRERHIFGKLFLA